MADHQRSTVSYFLDFDWISLTDSVVFRLFPTKLSGVNIYAEPLTDNEAQVCMLMCVVLFYFTGLLSCCGY